MTRMQHLDRTFDVYSHARLREIRRETDADFALWERDHFTTRIVRDALFAFHLMDIQIRGRNE